MSAWVIDDAQLVNVARAAFTRQQLAYLSSLAAEGAPVPARQMFSRLRFCKLRLSEFLAAGIVLREKIDGKVHYRLAGWCADIVHSLNQVQS